ncbi:EamA-like transporter family protein [Phaeovulum vinaykumarii]|uniref:EamA-like transporter family protein n=1 Tax=Phaeovulum vinaykumarii TaxID=407234 RepID=A0A1N7KXP9_9RHOB|nr:EamA-like transporter family protein [Phaeovulum vinaykumarii]SOC01100.1 EamA-like transporter family protein [Phaeovulum vinaykumarii]
MSLSPPPPHKRQGVILSLVCLGILSVMPIISNSRPAGFDALSFAALLSIWQTVLALPLVLAEWHRGTRGIFSPTLPAPERRRMGAVTVATGLMFGLATYLYVLSVEKAGATTAAIAIESYPLFAILWESLFLGRRKTRAELALTGVLLATMYYLGTGGTGRLEGVSVWFLLALAVPFLWSIAHVIIKEELGRSPITPAQVTLFRVAISAVALGGVAALIDPQALWQALSRPEFQAFGFLMGLCYYLELLVWFHALRHVDVSVASSITMPWPAFTMVLAALVLGDVIAPYQIGSFAVALVCIYGLTLLDLRKGHPA